MSTYCDPLILPRCILCGVSHIKPERLGEDGACVDFDWCMRNRRGVAGGR